ncbi:MAG: hypothetical protein KC418_15470 [Anaerolineales bacterium]|nr:hypothetical protein [Anaerolineales bacterium]
MENSFVVVGIVFVVLILAVVFFLVAVKYKRVKGEIDTPLGKGKFEGSNPTKQTKLGRAEISSLSGRNIKVKKVIGAKGPQVTQGEAHVTDIEAEEGIEFDDIIGLDQFME